MSAAVFAGTGSPAALTKVSPGRAPLRRVAVIIDLHYKPKRLRILAENIEPGTIALSRGTQTASEPTRVRSMGDLLDTCDLPHAWISLDETDNDLGVFLAHFLAAMEPLFPDALSKTRAFLTGINLPPLHPQYDLLAQLPNPSFPRTRESIRRSRSTSRPDGFLLSKAQE